MVENIRLTKQAWLGHLLGRNAHLDDFVKEAVIGLDRIDRVFRTEADRLTSSDHSLNGSASQPLPTLGTSEQTSS